MLPELALPHIVIPGVAEFARAGLPAPAATDDGNRWAWIEHWELTGERPSPVMAWTPEQTGLFLDQAADDRLYALFHLITFRGLRRGAACGRRWADTNLKSGLLTVAKRWS